MNPVFDVTPVRAIRLKCIECMGGNPSNPREDNKRVDQEISDCVSVTCPLWKFRLGKNPEMSNRKGPVARVSSPKTGVDPAKVG